jgi:hypothetical protein
MKALPMAKKTFDMSGVLTSDVVAARPLAAQTPAAPKPAPRTPRVAATEPPAAPQTPPSAADSRQLVGLTHKLDSERYAWMRDYLHAEQRRRGDYRFSGQQLYVERA